MRAAIWMGALWLGACAHRAAPAAGAAKSPPQEDLEAHDAFSCDSGEQLATDYDADSGHITLSLGQSVMRLERVPSESGAKFSDGHVTFWSHGEAATLQLSETATQVSCHRILER